MDELVKFYRGKRVLVTGDTGFKGSWLCLWLKELGAEVTGYALPPDQTPSHFDLLGLAKQIRHVDGNILDTTSLARVFSAVQPEILFHLAAQPIVRLSYASPKETFDTNVGGSVNVLEQVRCCSSLRSVIYVTSDKCYKNKEWIWGYRENDELGGHDPYSASKAAAEIVFVSYQSSFFQQREGFGAASVRAGNVIGGGDWAVDRIVPDCVRALRQGRPIELRFPAATRPWQHVLEPLSGYLLLGQRLWENPQAFAGAWNFGPGDEAIRTVEQLTRRFTEVWGQGAITGTANTFKPHEAGKLTLNCDKARQLLGWRPQWNFDRTVTETAEWYRHWSTGEDVAAISHAQILRYMEGLGHD